MKKIHLLPNLITVFGLSCGLFVIFKISLSTRDEWNIEMVKTLVIFLIFGGIADLLDGAIARLLKAESSFGVYLDSFADIITFGVCPSAMMLKNFYFDKIDEWIFLGMSSAMIYTICGVLRLARYSMQANQSMEERQDSYHSTEIIRESKPFIGLPIPAAAAGIVSLELLLTSQREIISLYLSERGEHILLLVVMFILGYFMISRWKFPSLKTLNLRVKSFHFVFISVVSTIFFFYGILHHFSLLFFLLAWGYITISWMLSIIRLVVGKKSHTLIEFEPENEIEEES